MPIFRTLFFDLDDTLYDNRNGLWEAIRNRMGDYMQNLLGLSPQETAELRRHYFMTYGTTLRGLQIHHQVDSEEYLAYVHDLPLDQYVQPDPDLRQILASLPQRKFIFTNADQAHAKRILGILGVSDCFNGIIDVRALDYRCKPEPEAYRIALRLAGEWDVSKCIFFDDSPRNLATARLLGFTTILIGNHNTDPSAHYSISSLKDLPGLLPELWLEENADDSTVEPD
jgi:pyrimidine 5'-nucleotidase